MRLNRFALLLLSTTLPLSVSTFAHAGTNSNLPASNSTETADQNNTQEPSVTIEDIQIGDGAEAVAGSKVLVSYAGWILNGASIGSSDEFGGPLAFTIGNGDLIPGFEIGVIGMKVGGKRKVTIPPELAYGDNGAGNVIPPGATLVFELELVAISPEQETTVN